MKERIYIFVCVAGSFLAVAVPAFGGSGTTVHSVGSALFSLAVFAAAFMATDTRLRVAPFLVLVCSWLFEATAEVSGLVDVGPYDLSAVLSSGLTLVALCGLVGTVRLFAGGLLDEPLALHREDLH